MYRDSKKYNTVSILQITCFSTKQKITLPKCEFYFINQETKTKLFFLVTVKIDLSKGIMSHETSFVAISVYELSWHNLNWSQFFFFFMDI